MSRWWTLQGVAAIGTNAPALEYRLTMILRFTFA
jgi:hypothetical protein